MDAARRRQIDELADRIRDALELNSFPIDVEQAVTRLRGELRSVPETEHEAKIKKSGNGFVVELAPTSSDERRRFNVAHELGHLFLHMGYKINPAKWDSVNEYLDSPLYRFGYSEEEYEAHEFAGAFLMPATEFKRVAFNHKSGTTYNVVPIAEHFDVSVPAARTRGRWLSVFSWD
jgi:Zn-dependent peptidase ImmA (M78 family)